MTQSICEYGSDQICAMLTLRTEVTERPLVMSVSAIQPPIFANTAIVNHGSTQKSPDSIRLNFNT